MGVQWLLALDDLYKINSIRLRCKDMSLEEKRNIEELVERVTKYVNRIGETWVIYAKSLNKRRARRRPSGMKGPE